MPYLALEMPEDEDVYYVIEMLNDILTYVRRGDGFRGLVSYVEEKNGDILTAERQRIMQDNLTMLHNRVKHPEVECENPDHDHNQ
jgi:hypothetical protein